MADLSRTRKMIIRTIDVIWSCIIITPLTIFYWGGTWKLLDLYLFPDDLFTSSCISLVIGSCGCITGYLFLPLINTCVSAERMCSVKHILTSRIAIYVLAFMVLNYWRGIWNLLDHFLGNGPDINGIVLSLAILVLMPLRALGNIVSSPFFVELDVGVSIYKPSTRFKTQPSKFWLYLADVLFSQILILGVAVMIWWALWNLMEAAILPDDRLLSYCLSLGVGYGASIILFMLQHPIAMLGRRTLQIHWTLAFMQHVTLRLIEAVVTLLVWRGGWGLNRDYLLDSTLDAAVAHGFGAGGLLLFQALATVSTLNIATDHEDPSASCFYYHIHYFKYFIERREEQADLQIQRRSSMDRGLLEDSDDDILGSSDYA